MLSASFPEVWRSFIFSGHSLSADVLFRDLRSRRDERNVLCPHSVSVGDFLDGHEILCGRAEFGATPDKMATSNGGGMEVDGAGKHFLFLTNLTNKREII